MVVGTICYATQSGLGILARDFVRNGVVNRIMVVKHPHFKTQSWYERPYSHAEADAFLDGLDCLLLFENGFHWDVVNKARQKGIRVVMMPMYECTHLPLPVPADLYLCPSLLDLQVYEERGLPSVFLPVPVSRPFKQRELARVFVHNAGHGGLKFRNGTPELIQALPLIDKPIKLLLRCQPGDSALNRLIDKITDPRVQVQVADVPEEELWATGDVFVFPEKFNGLSLPLQEAYASGLLIMAADRFPMNTWLPKEPLIPVAGYKTERIAVEFQSAIIQPQAIARQINMWYDRDITELSQRGRDWAIATSWEQLKPAYLEVLS